MIAPTPPASILIDLRRYDPELRLRWGQRTGLWIIEKRLPQRHHRYTGERPSPYKSPRGLDLFDGWKEGFVHVLFVHPSLLGAPVMWDALAGADTHRQGGVDALNRKLDEAEIAKQKASDKETHDMNAGAASDMFDRIAWLDGRRVTVPNPEPVEGRWSDEAHPDGFVIRDRRIGAGTV